MSNTFPHFQRNPTPTEERLRTELYQYIDHYCRDCKVWHSNQHNTKPQQNSQTLRMSCIRSVSSHTTLPIREGERKLIKSQLFTLGQRVLAIKYHSLVDSTHSNQ